MIPATTRHDAHIRALVIKPGRIGVVKLDGAAAPVARSAREPAARAAAGLVAGAAAAEVAEVEDLGEDGAEGLGGKNVSAFLSDGGESRTYAAVRGGHADAHFGEGPQQHVRDVVEVVGGCGQADGVLEADEGAHAGEDAEAEEDAGCDLGVAVHFEAPEERDGEQSAGPVCQDVR